MSAGFTHLHCHTEYSVLDGACKTSELLEKCKEYGMTSCAITDHGVIFGAVEFYLAAKRAHIKPIIGCELYVAKDGRLERGSGRGGNLNHFLVLCESLEGYHNLCKLSSLGFLEGFYYKPRVDDELLAKYSRGLIATSSCLAGQIPEYILRDDLDGANEAIAKYVRIFGKDNFLIELMDHGMPEQEKVNPVLAEMAEHHELTLIATNDCHYINQEDAGAHEALLCIQTNGLLDDENHFKFPTDKVYFRSPDEMRDLFSRWPEAVSNTEKIAERCNVELPLGQHLIPEFVIPDGSDKTDFLRSHVYSGLQERYGENVPQDCADRAEYELGVIESMGFVDYFLVVWDLINYARSVKIPVGPGRGSGAGSIVAYALRITNVDPIRYNLLFERFLNPERISMPDFDIDFCYVRREEMIEYARRKYGRENVSQIITFGRMLARQVVRNVGRVMGMPYADVDHLAKLIPEELKITLKEAHSREPEIRRMVKEDPQIAKLWRLARRLEGTVGNCGTHAAGVVICDKPLTDYVALYQAAGTTTVATQVEMKALKEVGLLKMDFLGLRTLTVIHDTVRLIKENRGIEIDIDEIEPDDALTYELLRSGHTTGIFQLESPGMRDLAKRIGLESLEEVCALIALYRPGPMDYIDAYNENKHHPETIKYHPLLEPILKETYGISVYQEHVLQIVQALAGFSLGQADILRSAMGDKKADLMEQQREKFIQGCKDNDIDETLAATLFSKIENFAGYGFNKSHSMAYAFVAYQTAYLKTNFPTEYMAALLSSESGNLDKIGLYVEECNRIGVEVLPPDVSQSDLQFRAEAEKIRFGLVAIKNVGEGPARAIVDERNENGPYKDVFDFCERLESRQVNRRLIESLNKAGALADTHRSRAQIEASIEQAMQEAQLKQRERDAGQSSLFDLLGTDASAETMRKAPECTEWSKAETLSNEKEVLGLYLSGHPLRNHGSLIERFATKDLEPLGQFSDNYKVIVAGILTELRQRVTSKGRKMAFATFETLEGTFEITFFSDTLERCEGLLELDSVLLVPSHVNYRNGTAGLVADDVVPPEKAESRLARALHIHLWDIQNSGGVVGDLARILGDRPGDCDVYFHCRTDAFADVVVHATHSCKVAPSQELIHSVESLVGTEHAWFSAGNGMPHHT